MDNISPSSAYQKAMYALNVISPNAPIPSYTKWLEDQYEILAYPHQHPTEEERAEMTGEEAATAIAQRVYDAACLAERFEVGNKHGRFVGNGHHFAQKMYKAAEEEALLRWHPKA
jgi:hypothetical protein